MRRETLINTLKKDIKMKHIHSFEEFLNENVRLSKTDKLLDKMTIDDFGDKWVMNIVEVDNEIDPNSPDIGKEVYITLTGKYARDTTSDSLMIPKEQWEEFKKLINKI
jgi:hypothetical protein